MKYHGILKLQFFSVLEKLYQVFGLAICGVESLTAVFFLKYWML